MKIFVCSDIHGFFTEFKQALDDAGFEQNNKNHLLVICGDLLDRGQEPQKIIDYLMKTRNKVLVRGNHEILFKELCDRQYSHNYDYHNGTFDTILDLAPNAKYFDEACKIALNKMMPILNQMVNYFETKHYIFVHSTIPFKDDWRNATNNEFNEAMWGNPFEFWKQNKIPNKIVIFGHWHSSAYNSPDDQFSETSDFGIAYGDGFIGLDACTAFSHKINILIIEDELIISSK